jgi:LPXTG-site transpeptidase (sortase) family protein
MKIEEDDLIRLFDKDEITLIPEDTWVEIRNRPQKVDVKKATIKIEEEKIKKLRRQIKRLPHRSQKRSTGIIEKILKFLIFAGFAGFALFALISFPAFYSQLKWYYYTDYLGKSYPQAQPVRSLIPHPNPTSPSPTPSLPQFMSPTPIPTVSALIPQPVVVKAEGNYIKIDKISVNAPVLWNVEEANIINDLKNGVVHYKGTSLPGDGGNAVLVGHSSNYIWVKSDYSQVFTLLNKLVVGDRIEVRRGTISHFYDVVSTKVVSPRNVEILNSVDKETLTLLTCWPVGTSLNRLVVEAQLKYSN